MAASNLKVVTAAAETRRPVIELRGVSKTYRTRDGEVPSLRPIDLTVGEGEFVVVVGPSGCGKTTLLKMIAGLLPPSEGEIRVEGHAKEAAFAARIHGQPDKRRGQKRAVLYHAEGPALLADEQPAVRCEGHRGWVQYPGNHGRVHKMFLEDDRAGGVGRGSDGEGGRGQ